MQSPQYYKIKINISFFDCVKYYITVQGQYQIPYKSVLVNSLTCQSEGKVEK